MEYHAMIHCEICGKPGAVLSLADISLNNFLWGKMKNGFTRKTVATGASMTVCERCSNKNDTLLADQEEKRQEFITEWNK